MNIKHFIACAFSVLFLFGSSGFAQAAACDRSEKRVRYQILNENITNRDSKSRIFVQIFIEPKRFTIHAMINLSSQIKCDYKEFDSIAVSIFDNKRGEKLPDPPPHPLFELPSDNPPRGFFEFQKQPNTAELTFQEKRNNKFIDIEILFTADGYCVTETLVQPSGNE